MFLKDSPECAVTHLFDDTGFHDEVGQLPQGPDPESLADILRTPGERLKDHADFFLTVLGGSPRSAVVDAALRKSHD